MAKDKKPAIDRPLREMTPGEFASRIYAQSFGGVHLGGRHVKA